MFNSYAEHYEVLNQKKPYKKEIEFVFNWARKPKKILDIGCGTANYWQYFPKGTKILGFEKSQQMIEQSAHKEKIIWGDITKTMPYEKDFDLVTALFDVINYLPENNFWANLPVKQDGYFVFDVWDKDKVLNDGFHLSVRFVGNVARIIQPVYQDDTKVRLSVILTSATINIKELHEMYLYSFEDIMDFAGNDFDIVDVKRTEKWQTWLKLKKR